MYCEVPRMILMHDLKGAMLLYHSKDMCMFSTYNSYDFNTLMPIVWKVWCW